MLRITKHEGTVIIMSPNLLSPFLPLKSIYNRFMRRESIEIAGLTFFQSFSCLLKNMIALFNKIYLHQNNFLYRVPVLSQPSVADSDSVYLSTQIDIIRFFKKNGARITGQSKGHSLVGKIIARLFPHACGELFVAARVNKE